VIWVVAQFVVMWGVVVSWRVTPHYHVTALLWAGLAVALTGVALMVWARRTLGRSFTMFPRPKPGGRLVTDGPFALVRHPIYGGAILFFAGCSLAFSPWGLAATLVLALLWVAKARVEERNLAQRFPEYADYRRRVRKRLLPLVY
jgi:protein-S-isoprenylcysteine O-methyltransferase Ste14